MADVHTGAQALRDLLDVIARLSDEGSCCIDDYPAGESPDLRDYRAMAEAVERSIMQNLSREPAHREGYLRALSHLLCLVADGCGPEDGDGWEPISATAVAFMAQSAAASAIRRAAQ